MTDLKKDMQSNLTSAVRDIVHQNNDLFKQDLIRQFGVAQQAAQQASAELAAQMQPEPETQPEAPQESEE
jgi:hypothetical protein